MLLRIRWKLWGVELSRLLHVFGGLLLQLLCSIRNSANNGLRWWHKPSHIMTIIPVFWTDSLTSSTTVCQVAWPHRWNTYKSYIGNLIVQMLPLLLLLPVLVRPLSKWIISSTSIVALQWGLFWLNRCSTAFESTARRVLEHRNEAHMRSILLRL